MSIEIRAYGRSDVGRRRLRNEDMLEVDPSAGMVVVADGMGGGPAGDVASAMAVREVVQGLRAGEGMVESIHRANRKIWEMVRAQPSLFGMGTTLTALRISSESRTFVMGHVGDSRAYLLSNDTFSQLSRDHTLVREMVEGGKIPPEAERDHHLSHVLSRALGTKKEVEVDLLEGSVSPGDHFLLCSDGLMKVMEEEEIEGWVRRAASESLEDLVDEIVAEGNRRGAPDNITVAILSAGTEAE